MGRHREFDIDQALESALAVFWKKGYEGASFEDLTQATGVARPGLYAAFGNKESLFLKALDRYQEKYLCYVPDALLQSGSAAMLRVLLEGSVHMLTLCPEKLGCLGLNGALACSDSSENVRLELVRRRASAEDVLRLRLEYYRSIGDLPADSDCHVLAGYVTSVNQGLAVQAKSGTSRDDLLAIVNQVIACWPGTRK